MAKSIFIEHLLSNEVPYEKVAQYLGCSIETVLRHSEKMRQNYVNNIHKIRTNYTNFTYIIKVSNSSKNNSLSCISKNEGNEKK